MSNPIVVVATFRPKPGTAADLTALVEQLIPEVQANDPGCIRYALHDAGDDVMVMIEQWESQDALEAHGASPRFTAFTTAIEDLLASPLEVRVLRPHPVGDAAKGAL